MGEKALIDTMEEEFMSEELKQVRTTSIFYSFPKKASIPAVDNGSTKRWNG